MYSINVQIIKLSRLILKNLQRKKYYILVNQIKDPEADPISIEEFDKEKSLRRTKINKILAYFLISIGPKLSVDAYREVI